MDYSNKVIAVVSENDSKAIRDQLLDMAQGPLTDIAERYNYTALKLDASIKWRPIILVLGNYSSGKSTLINDLLGKDIQKTGQAPTDDSFTVITYGTPNPGQTTEERDGGVLLGSPDYPFSSLRRHGERFAAHFRLKIVESELLRDLAIIDTPGMLDSVGDAQRGYDYQQVIADLAEIADLVIVMFDPHKAGTVGETHTSLRSTLPGATTENRVIYVLNRIDECAHLRDLLRVYGTLCWNLSQMTQRKDIPPILLTSSKQARAQFRDDEHKNYLRAFDADQQELYQRLHRAGVYRLDRMVGVTEDHIDRLDALLKGLLWFKNETRKALWRRIATIGLVAGAFGGTTWLLSALGVIDLSSVQISSEVLVLVVFFVSGLFATWLSFFNLKYQTNSLLRDVKESPPWANDLKDKELWLKVRPVWEKLAKADRFLWSKRRLQKDLQRLSNLKRQCREDIRKALMNHLQR